MFYQIGFRVYKKRMVNGAIVHEFHRSCQLPCEAAIMVRELNSIYPGEYQA